MARTIPAAALALALAAPAAAVTGPVAENPESTVRLVSPWAVAPAEGELWLGLAFTTAPGWHVYWKNSGDAGYPPAVSFAATPEIEGAEILYPAPHRYDLPGGLVSYGYEGEVVYPLRARLAAAGRERLAITADLDYLVCEVDCVPYSVRLTLDQSLAGAGRPAIEDPGTAPLLSAWLDRLPAPPEALGVTTAGALDLSDPARPALDVAVEGAPAAEAAEPELFLEVHDLFTAGTAEVERTAGGLGFRVPIEWREQPERTPERLEVAWTVTGLAAPGGAGTDGTAAIEARRTVVAGDGGRGGEPSPAVRALSLRTAGPALGALAAILAALASWGLLGRGAGADAPAGDRPAGAGGRRNLRILLGFAALAVAVGLLWRLALALPSDALAGVELALLAVALAAWARHRALGPVFRTAMLAAMLVAGAVAVGLAARAGTPAGGDPAPAERVAEGR